MELFSVRMVLISKWTLRHCGKIGSFPLCVFAQNWDDLGIFLSSFLSEASFLCVRTGRGVPRAVWFLSSLVCLDTHLNLKLTWVSSHVTPYFGKGFDFIDFVGELQRPGNSIPTGAVDP